MHLFHKKWQFIASQVGTRFIASASLVPHASSADDAMQKDELHPGSLRQASHCDELGTRNFDETAPLSHIPQKG